MFCKYIWATSVKLWSELRKLWEGEDAALYPLLLTVIPCCYLSTIISTVLCVYTKIMLKCIFIEKNYQDCKQFVFFWKVVWSLEQVGWTQIIYRYIIVLYTFNYYACMNFLVLSEFRICGVHVAVYCCYITMVDTGHRCATLGK